MANRQIPADDVSRTAAMNIGEIVLYEGRQYFLRGLDPMGVPQRQAFLEDALNGEARAVPLDDLELEPPPDRPPLRGV
jgi:hypothetical protein